ncbi:MAG: hypothetical protein ACR2HN_10205 [Tepidiformaceae bacterium]
MAVTTRYVPRRGQIPFVWVTATLAVAFLAVIPIAAAVFGGAAGAPARTAFASAPAGNYLVMARTEGTVDVVSVVPLADPAAPVEIARVNHLPGYSSSGAVSPDGRTVALVVAEAGTVARPGAALLTVDLETAAVNRLAIDVELLQVPLWAPDSASIVVTRRAAAGAHNDVTFLRVALDGSTQSAGSAAGVLGAYAVGFDGAGRLITVVIDGRGSTALRAGVEAVSLSAQVTRDWQLSPDGSSIAFIEADLSGGLTYRARVASLDGVSPGVAAQALNDGRQHLGVAWKRDTGEPTFGAEPATAGVTAQGAAPGFDVPLAYAPDGSALALQHWGGPSFAAPGPAEFQVVTGQARTSISGFTRFLGWAAR